MSFNIVDLVKDQISDSIMGQIGNLMGDQSSQASSGLSSALPALLNGFTQRGAVPGGADALFGAVEAQDDGILDNLGSLLGGNDSKSMIDAGSSVLGSLFGNSGLGTLAGIVSGVSGLSKGNTGTLMGLLAPIVMGVIKRKLMGGGGLNAGGLMDMLTSQKSNISAAMPQGMSDQLSSSSFLSSITNVGGDIADGVSNIAGNVGDAAGNLAGSVGDAASSVTDAASSAGSAAAETVSTASSGGSSMFKKLIPIIGLALLAWLGLKFFGGSADEAADAAKDAASTAASTATDAASTATDAATDAAAKVADAVDIDVDGMGTDLTGMFDSASESLGGITDLESAKAALPKLTEVGDKVSGLGGMLDKVPEAARGPLNGIISKGIEALTPLIEKVSAIPGVGDVIKPIVEPIMETLKGLAG